MYHYLNRQIRRNCGTRLVHSSFFVSYKKILIKFSEKKGKEGSTSHTWLNPSTTFVVSISASLSCSCSALSTHFQATLIKVIPLQPIGVADPREKVSYSREKIGISSIVCYNNHICEAK